MTNKVFANRVFYNDIIRCPYASSHPLFAEWQEEDNKRLKKLEETRKRIFEIAIKTKTNDGLWYHDITPEELEELLVDFVIEVLGKNE